MLNEHKRVELEDTAWAYKLNPMTIDFKEGYEEFQEVMPQYFIQEAAQDDLSRGLLRRVDFISSATGIVGVKLVFHNGRDGLVMGTYGRQLAQK